MLQLLVILKKFILKIFLWVLFKAEKYHLQKLYNHNGISSNGGNFIDKLVAVFHNIFTVTHPSLTLISLKRKNSSGRTENNEMFGTL
jgi:hypothetical protein